MVVMMVIHHHHHHHRFQCRNHSNFIKKNDPDDSAPGVSRRTLLAGDEETGMEHLVGRPTRALVDGSNKSWSDLDENCVSL